MKRALFLSLAIFSGCTKQPTTSSNPSNQELAQLRQEVQELRSEIQRDKQDQKAEEQLQAALKPISADTVEVRLQHAEADIQNLRTLLENEKIGRDKADADLGHRLEAIEPATRLR